MGSSVIKDQIQKHKDKPHDTAQYKKNLALGALFMAEKVVSIANYGLEEFNEGMEKARLSGEY